MSFKVGDKVMVVWACCARSREDIGSIGEVVSAPFFMTTAFCGCCWNARQGHHVTIKIEGDEGDVPVAWLTKLPPDTESQTLDELTEAEA